MCNCPGTVKIVDDAGVSYCPRGNIEHGALTKRGASGHLPVAVTDAGWIIWRHSRDCELCLEEAERL